MTVRQWLWRVSAGAPLPVWMLSFALPLVFAGWSLQEGGGSSLDELRRQREDVTSAMVALRQELDTLEQYAEGDASDAAVPGRLALLLHHRCGLQRGFELKSDDGRTTLMLTADSLASLCALRVIRRYQGGLRHLLRQEDGTVSFTWEGA